MAKDPGKSRTYRCDVIKALMSYKMPESEAFDLVIKHKNEVEQGISLTSFPLYVAQRIVEIEGRA